MPALRSASVIAAVTAHLDAGRVLTIRDGETTYTAGPSKKADGHHGWEINTYAPGGKNETDDSFHSSAQLARELVRVMFDKRRVDAALLAAQCCA